MFSPDGAPRKASAGSAIPRSEHVRRAAGHEARATAAPRGRHASHGGRPASPARTDAGPVVTRCRHGPRRGPPCGRAAGRRRSSRGHGDTPPGAARPSRRRSCIPPRIRDATCGGGRVRPLSRGPLGGPPRDRTSGTSRARAIPASEACDGHSSMSLATAIIRLATMKWFGRARTDRSPTRDRPSRSAHRPDETHVARNQRRTALPRPDRLPLEHAVDAGHAGQSDRCGQAGADQASGRSADVTIAHRVQGRDPRRDHHPGHRAAAQPRLRPGQADNRDGDIAAGARDDPCRAWVWP